MPKYDVTFIKVTKETVRVEAKSAGEAEDIVSDCFGDNLDSQEYDVREFSVWDAEEVNI